MLAIWKLPIVIAYTNDATGTTGTGRNKSVITT
jgi:hypothetical protein